MTHNGYGTIVQLLSLIHILHILIPSLYRSSIYRYSSEVREEEDQLLSELNYFFSG